MKRSLAVVVGAALVMAVPVTASAAPPAEGAPAPPARAHDLTSPLADKQRELRAAALEKVLRGEATPQGENKVVQVAKGQYVELAQEDSDAIWTILGEFADLPHNSIPEPDRAVDNSTIWAEDFSQPYFAELLYSTEAGVNSVANFYEELSSGRYTVTGEVEDWVQVPGTGASYGDNDLGDAVTWTFVNDTMNTWYAGQLDSGKTVAQIDEYLSQFDVWDRYDHDDDGDFDEADGYIDHFQAVHSGMGEEVGGGVLGDDAIWSHRWYNQTTGIGEGGPTIDGHTVPFGGARVGQSKYWVGDYTVEPENGGVGVFAHEFAHDLGLPDLYDTSGNSGGAENSTAFWTLMSSGSYGNSGQPADGIGTKPIHMGAWEKLQLGWLNYELVQPGAKLSTKLGPSTANTKQAQAVIALLPDREVTTTVGAPHEGTDFWYSGSGDGLDHAMLAPLPAGGTTLTAQVAYEIEPDWDYAYAVYSTDGGKTVTSLQTNRSTSTDPNGQNFGHGITGGTGGEWVDLTVDVSQVPAGAQIGFRYWTDGAVAEPGLQVDAVEIGDTPITAWTLNGFEQTTGTTTEDFFNAYLLENRAYTAYDDSLRTGPYNFGNPTQPGWAEHFPYQDGLLISYWNSQYGDNNVGAHPGAGLILPVDAHPGLLYEPTDDEGTDRTDGESWRPRVQSYDSTFGRQATDRFTLHDPDTGVAGTVGGLPAVPTFDDTLDWWVAPGEQPDANGWTGVDVPKTGTRITVVSTSAHDTFMQVRIN
ncbi:immune inhibitor A domain-containing protein [Blastococcus saxobsidens]|uniref:Putattive Peptidase M6 immune inhibitor A n=1 Tax=Blastococcus saxobsidens (strain DD2) TaxID=1146883 RepID=H6RM31_BLASD|nr:immune inhibitor A domain-containing protein [Blastococcus saxobsidens]CCG01273.1 Putattive Peptidase M6 immune inhibitor A [Blastococcus saxobsidens DD2]